MQGEVPTRSHHFLWSFISNFDFHVQIESTKSLCVSSNVKFLSDGAKFQQLNHTSFSPNGRKKQSRIRFSWVLFPINYINIITFYDVQKKEENLKEKSLWWCPKSNNKQTEHIYKWSKDGRYNCVTSSIREPRQTSISSHIVASISVFFSFHSTTTQMWNGSNIKRRANQEMRKQKKKKKTIKNIKRSLLFLFQFFFVGWLRIERRGCLGELAITPYGWPGDRRLRAKVYYRCGGVYIVDDLSSFR